MAILELRKQKIVIFMTMVVTDLQEDVSAKVIELHGGIGLQNQLRSIGIREGKIISLVTIHPFKGPVVIKVDGEMITLGRGLASRIVVEIIR